MQQNYYWAKIDGKWEVVEVSGAFMYRAGSDVPVEHRGGEWFEMGEKLDIQNLTGPLLPPNT